ncbi:MAG: amidohydrolase family protein [Sphingopyxis sp.]|uniref:N-acyl-D-amino-acid deacylase family protein n=1 Tax=Sphingopyxis sp. TaxID=1908224 RepID=UPI002ABAD91B|nr:amidohydrolase family protein [Sphingopyxis sp.]MDZ3831645.1 amidohydrolase family protein [Sphingopyxis sp.]
MKTLPFKGSFLAAVALTALAVTAAPVTPTPAMAADGATTVIRGGTIYDGSTRPPIVGDVVITGARITYVGPTRPAARGARIVDARGLVVAPGFIDPHTHPRGYIDSDAAQDRLNLPWLMQGVTTIFVGVDGGGTPHVADFFDALETKGFGTNVGAYVGFGPVRRAVLEDDARAPSPAELDKMKALVAGAMCEGALGLSTGLFYAPQSFAKTGEVVALAREAAARGGLYDTHQRDESSYSIGVAQSVAEAIDIGKQADIPVHFAHIKALGVDVHGKAGEIIAMIEKARAAGQRVTADQYPWEASGTGIEAALLPRWAVDGGRSALLARLDNPADLARIKEAMAENMRRRGGAHSLLLTAPDREWTALRLDAIAARWKMTPIDAALKIVRHDEDGGSLVSFNMAEEDIRAFMTQPWVVTGSDGSPGHPRMFASFPQKYAKYVVDGKLIDMTDFINSSTGRTADIFGLADRGYLKPGYYADVLLLDPATYRPQATYVAPRELTKGVRSLFVNGQQVIESGKPTGIAAGKAIRRTPPGGSCPG